MKVRKFEICVESSQGIASRKALHTTGPVYPASENRVQETVFVVLRKLVGYFIFKSVFIIDFELYKFEHDRRTQLFGC